jgi:putative Holliday junction resolvase
MAAAAAVILAFDYGVRRIGVAVGQTTTGTASPAGVIPVRGAPDWDAVERCVREWSPARLLVGVPYNMDGTETALTATCRAFARQLARRFGLPVDCVDERLTSAAATADLREARRSGARSRRVRREDIDAHAARLILETWLRGPAH